MILPGCPEFDPFVEQPPIVELAKQTGLCDRVRGIALRTNIG